ncbi:aminotransferase class I/II-fold pyridoxal phosphate-dependent enzyme [Waterburya agarophytonicola K14]|uniref:Aminotransferase class I/II-fold pyridoxal phosphate-dependent enzyme n=1 Tax=Waterburya agarophytonicola KI4 TaxID=2874699 RepID=A0A964FL81_9CYAN|nr:aminotransferase class I/II-fold pyridoxal phosphate-dependent enzyme [Waterburya agarophytonicola KI4]
MKKQILLSTPHMGEQERKFVTEAFDTNWVAPIGPNVDAFEREFSTLVGSQYSAALSSGTAALHLALKLVGVEAGDEVFCSTFTFIASASPITYLGAKPVFIDSDRTSWNMDPNLLSEALAQKAKVNKLPKAVVLVHLYGQSADIEPILEICDRYSVPLIEDAAEALGATYKNTSPGTWGRAGIFSFNGNKIITTSGGGMLVSDDGDLIEKARFLATQARDPEPHYEHTQIGFNYRLSNISAGIGRGQLAVLSERVAARCRNFATYKSALGDLPGIEFMPEPDYGKSTHWLSCLTFDPNVAKIDREQVRLHLAKHNIETRPLWKPMHLQPVFSDCECFNSRVSEELFQKGLCIPSGSNLSEEDLSRVITEIKKVYRHQ